MRLKIYRWLDYNKWDLIIIVSGIILFSWIISCKPEYNDVQMRTFKTDTLKTDTNASKH